MATVMAEACRGYEVDLRILATDISTAALGRCRDGFYREDKLEQLSPTLRKRYFQRFRSSDPPGYRVRESLRAPLVFARLNLAAPPYPMRGPFDVILCRNVMIYFDRRVRERLLGELYRLVRPGGYVLVGHAESLTGISSAFDSVRPSVYRRGRR